MPSRPGPFEVFEIAKAIARDDGLFSFDRDEAARIVTDMVERYLRGEIDAGDVLVLADREGERRLCQLAEAGSGDDSRNVWLWQKAVMLSDAGTRRYLEICGHRGAARVLGEWFGGEASMPDPEEAAGAQAGLATAASDAAAAQEGAAEPPKAVLSIPDFVEQYIAGVQRPSKRGLELAWQGAKRKGRREQRNSEFDRLMGDAAPQRGRPKKSPE